MSPEIACRHASTIKQWKEEKPELTEPLPFEVPPGVKPNLGDCGLWGDSTVDIKYFYHDAAHGHRNLVSLLWSMPIAFAFCLLVMIILLDLYTIAGVQTWLLTLILVGIVPINYLIWKRMPHWENNVFSRDDGKMYINLGKNHSHEVLDFYDQHFFALKLQLQYNTYGGLYYVAKDENGKLDFPVRLIKTPTYEEALQAWYFLVRFMDKDWPFGDADKKILQEIHEHHIKELGWKFGGILHEDGTRDIPSQR